MQISRGHSQFVIAAALSVFACSEPDTEVLPIGTGGANVAVGGNGNVLSGTQPGIPGSQGGSVFTRGGAGATLGGKGGTLNGSGVSQGGKAAGQGGSGVVAQGGKATGGTTARSTGGSSSTTKGGSSSTGSGGKATGGSSIGTGGKSTAGGKTSAGGVAGLGGGTVTSGGAASTNGYVSADPWKGYAWTAVSEAGATISPADFKTVKSGDPLCAKGTVNSSTKSDSVAMVGINLNQALGSTSIGTWAVTGSGIKINVTNRTSTVPLRVQIQTPNGSTLETERWCAKLDTSTTGTKTIPWGDFNTKCWDNSGTFFDKSKALSAVLIMVPGNDKTNLTFDYCVNSIALDTSTNTGTGGSGGGGNGGGGAGNLTGSGTLTGQYESTHVQRDGKDYVVQNNVWGASAAQTLKYVGNTFEITQQTGNNGGQGAPVSYPSTFIGSNNNRTTTGSNLPKQISTIQSVQTSWSTNAGSVSGVYNASYDVWFSTGGGGDAGSPSGGYLMVWLYDPSSAQPIGDLQSGSFSTAGGTFDVWFGYNGSKPCVSYLYRGNTTSLTFDLNVFIKDAVSRGYLQNSWYLTNVFAGFEIWSGGVGLKSTAFYVDVK